MAYQVIKNIARRNRTDELHSLMGSFFPGYDTVYIPGEWTRPPIGFLFAMPYVADTWRPYQEGDPDIYQQVWLCETSHAPLDPSEVIGERRDIPSRPEDIEPFWNDPRNWEPHNYQDVLYLYDNSIFVVDIKPIKRLAANV